MKKGSSETISSQCVDLGPSMNYVSKGMGGWVGLENTSFDEVQYCIYADI
jgi:hypothetical protein